MITRSEKAFSAQHTERVGVKCACLYFAIALVLLAKAPKFIFEVVSCRPGKCQDQQFCSAEACF